VGATRAALISRLRRFDFSASLVPFRWRRHKTSTQISIKQPPIVASRREQLPPSAFAFPLVAPSFALDHPRSSHAAA
jgi:hypothetical protein